MKLLLIDIDDTICNSSEAYEFAQKECYRFLKKKYSAVSENLFNKLYDLAKHEIHKGLNGTASMHNRFLYFQRLFEHLGLTLDPVLLDNITDLYWETTYKKIKLYPNVLETLKILKQNNIKIGVVSDLIANVQIRKLKKLNISQYIDFIVTSEEAGVEKPHPSIFQLALGKANCLPSDAVMIGDNYDKDVKGAEAIGIRPILINNNRAQVETVHSFKELLKVFNVRERKLNVHRKVIIFDLMGTIFKEGHIIQKILYPLLEKYKIKVSYESIKSLYVNYTLNKITQTEFWKTVPERVENEFLVSLELNKDTFKIIKYLKNKGYAVGILSNLPISWGKYLIHKYKLDDYFDPIVFSGNFASRKPDEKLYIIFSDNAKVLPENCFLVDDKLENLREARFLLMKTIWIKQVDTDVIFIPDYQIKKIQDLKDIF